MDIKVDKLDFQVLRLVDETGEYIELNLRDELSVNEDNLEREMLEQPSKYVYWSSVLEKLRMFKESAELELEMLEGRLDKEAREELPKQDVKVTKDAIEGYIRRTESYVQAREKCNQYEYLVKRLQFIVKAFEQRKDMLQSYGKQLTQEKLYGKGAGRQFEKNPEYPDSQFHQNQHLPPPNPYNGY